MALMTLEYWGPCFLGFLYLLPAWTLFHNSTVYVFIKHLRMLLFICLKALFQIESVFFHMVSLLPWIIFSFGMCTEDSVAVSMRLPWNKLCYTIKTALQSRSLACSAGSHQCPTIALHWYSTRGSASDRLPRWGVCTVQPRALEAVQSQEVPSLPRVHTFLTSKIPLLSSTALQQHRSYTKGPGGP